MPEHLVTGIAQSSDPSKLEDAFCEKPTINCDKLSVITKDEPTDEHEESLLTFLHVGQEHVTTDVEHDVITGGTGILTSIDPNVPGISSDTRYVGFFAEPHIIDHLADWPIPVDEVQNYNDAIDAGRSVVTYKATANEAPKVEQTFKEAGLKNVKTFESS